MLLGDEPGRAYPTLDHVRIPPARDVVGATFDAPLRALNAGKSSISLSSTIFKAFSVQTDWLDVGSFVHRPVGCGVVIAVAVAVRVMGCRCPPIRLHELIF